MRTLRLKYRFAVLAVVAVLVIAACGDDNGAEADGGRTHELLHVSYDIAREIFRNVNEAFVPWYESQNPGVRVVIEQSHAGSSRQARAVAEGLPADLVSMNQFLDVELIYNATRDNPDGPVIAQDWYTQYPNNSNPYSGTMAFVVRRGNPKDITDWSDLVRPDVEVVAPNYRTTGNGRFSYLTAWAYALDRSGGDDESAYEFVREIVGNTPVLATGGRDATTIFVERGLGDVLLTFEAEVNLIVNEMGPENFEVVVPSYGIDAKMYVVVGELYAREKGNLEIARAYWEFLYSREGQAIIAQNYYRPYDTAVAAEYAHLLPELALFDVEDVFGGWAEANQVHFSDGGTFDRITTELGRR